MKAQDAVKVQGSASAFGLVSIGPNDDLVAALLTMRRLNIHHLLVQDGNEVLGVVSDRGILERAFLTEKASLDSSKRIRDAMMCDVPRVQIDTDLADIVDAMRDVDASAAIVYSGDKVCGLITETDLLRQLTKLLSDNDELEVRKLSQLFLADPVVQRIMKAVSDVGI